MNCPCSPRLVLTPSMALKFATPPNYASKRAIASPRWSKICEKWAPPSKKGPTAFALKDAKPENCVARRSSRTVTIASPWRLPWQAWALKDQRPFATRSAPQFPSLHFLRNWSAWLNAKNVIRETGDTQTMNDYNSSGFVGGIFGTVGVFGNAGVGGIGGSDPVVRRNEMAP